MLNIARLTKEGVSHFWPANEFFISRVIYHPGVWKKKVALVAWIIFDTRLQDLLMKFSKEGRDAGQSCFLDMRGRSVSSESNLARRHDSRKRRALPKGTTLHCLISSQTYRGSTNIPQHSCNACTTTTTWHFILYLMPTIRRRIEFNLCDFIGPSRAPKGCRCHATSPVTISYAQPRT